MYILQLILARGPSEIDDAGPRCRERRTLSEPRRERKRMAQERKTRDGITRDNRECQQREYYLGIIPLSRGSVTNYFGVFMGIRERGKVAQCFGEKNTVTTTVRNNSSKKRLYT